MRLILNAILLAMVCYTGLEIHLSLVSDDAGLPAYIVNIWVFHFLYDLTKF